MKRARNTYNKNQLTLNSFVTRRPREKPIPRTPVQPRYETIDFQVSPVETPVYLTPNTGKTPVQERFGKPRRLLFPQSPIGNTAHIYPENPITARSIFTPIELQINKIVYDGLILGNYEPYYQTFTIYGSTLGSYYIQLENGNLVLMEESYSRNGPKYIPSHKSLEEITKESDALNNWVYVYNSFVNILNDPQIKEQIEKKEFSCQGYKNYNNLNSRVFNGLLNLGITIFSKNPELLKFLIEGGLIKRISDMKDPVVYKNNIVQSINCVSYIIALPYEFASKFNKNQLLADFNKPIYTSPHNQQEYRFSRQQIDQNNRNQYPLILAKFISLNIKKLFPQVGIPDYGYVKMY